ncbi:Protein MSN5 [Trichinella spiralis]|uniref:Protein MSN5 n=1 Tax=Trichinella spiralis TaxID=6334 RepID=A0ABR3K768_TRISP
MTPGSVDSVVVELMRPGMASILIPSDGIVHLTTRLSQSKSRKSCDSHSFILRAGGVGNPSSVYRAFIDILAIDKSTPSAIVWRLEAVASHIIKRNKRDALRDRRLPNEDNVCIILGSVVIIPSGPNTLNFPDMNINASDTTPKAGSTRIYTSGCPKNQNMCWNRMGSPPPEVSKKVVPKLRSVRSMMMGRDKKHVVMKLILPAIDEMPAKCREKITRSTLWLGCPSQVDSGGRGKDMSAAPAIIGISQFPNPLSSIGITMKKIIASAWADGLALVSVNIVSSVISKGGSSFVLRLL